MATPEGYIVPMEPLQVCHVHGMHYVSAHFPHMPVDEGFVSVEHSPYLSETVHDPSSQRHSAEDGNKSNRTFSDLQEAEKRQIKEMLQEQNKPSKNDTADFSDSGVSETDEPVVIELSSDELESRDQHNSSSSNWDQNDLSSTNTSNSDSVSDCSENSVKDDHNTELSNDIDESSTLESTKVNKLSKESSSDSCISSSNSNDNLSNSSVQNVEDVHESQLSDITDNACSINEEISLSNQENENISVRHLCDEKSHLESSDSLHGEPKVPSVKPKIRKRKSICSNDVEDKSPECVSVSTNELMEASDRSALICDNHTENSESNTNIDNTNHENEIKTNHKEESIKHELDDSGCEEQYQPFDILCDEQDNHYIDDEIQGLKDLKVTEAVKRWIREVTPEKAFSLSDEVQSLILAQQIIHNQLDINYSSSEEENADSDINSVTESKNGVGNPFAASSSDYMVDNGKRVASSTYDNDEDIVDDYDGASTISNLSQGHLYSECSTSLPISTCQSFDDETDDRMNDPSIYDPTSYTKYYQFGIEVDEVTPVPSIKSASRSCSNSRENTPAISESIALSECGSEEVEVIPHNCYENGQMNYNNSMSLATEILKAEKIQANMAHITGKICNKEELASPYCGNPGTCFEHYNSSEKTNDSQCNVKIIRKKKLSNQVLSSPTLSSGLGSSLASSPTDSPAHPTLTSRNRPILNPYPLKNLSVGDGPIPCKTICCAVM